MKARLAIIGPGNIARTFAKGAKLAKNADVTAVVSRTLEKAQKFAKEYEIEKAYGSYDDMLNDPDIDGVYIATPISTHFDLIKMCIEAGKPVICEKSLVLDTKESEAIIKFAKEKNVLLMEAMWTRFLPTVRKAHEWIAEGKIGETTMVDVSFGFPGPFPQGKMFDPSYGGGANYTMGVYGLEFSLDFGNSPMKKISSFSHFGETGVDENSMVNIQFENNVIASANSSVRVRMSNDAYVYGNDGFIYFENFHMGNTLVRYDRFKEKVETFTSDNQTNFEGFKFEIEHFADLVLNGEKESPIMPLSASYECAKIFDVIWEESK